MQLNTAASPGEQREAIIMHRVVTSVFITPLAQVAESHELTSSFTNITKQPQQRKSVFPLDEIGGLVSTFNTFGVAQLLVHYHHRFHRWLFIFKSFGLGRPI